MFFEKLYSLFVSKISVARCRLFQEFIRIDYVSLPPILFDFSTLPSFKILTLPISSDLAHFKFTFFSLSTIPTR